MDLPGCQNTFEKIPTQPHTLHTLPLPRSLGLAACCCSSRPIIGMDEHWTTLTRRRPLVESTVGHPARELRDIRLLAVTKATGWTRPHAVFAQMFQYLSKWSMHRAHQALLFFSAEP